MRVPRTEAHILGRVQSGASRKADEKSEQIFVEAGIWCLTTNRQRCFATVEAAGKELVQLARLKMNIGAFRAPRTVLAVQKYKSHYWLWTVSLWLTSLGSQLDDASRAGDETRLEEALCIYAKVLVRALRLKVDKDLRLRLEPRRFGLLCGEAFYLPDQMDTGGEFWGAGSAVLRRFDEYQRLPGALRGYQRALEQDLVKNFSHEELQQLDLVAELAAFVPHSFAANVAQKQLISVLSCEVRVVAS